MMAETTKKIVSIIAAEMKLDPASLDNDTKLDTLNIESLDMVNILFKVEETFDVYVPFDQTDNRPTTIGDIVTGVDKLLAEKAA
jgi:acyl carrier protein